MERQSLEHAATNAASQNQSSHSYSAWRTAQQTQPRIFQYSPPNAQQQQQSSQQSNLAGQAGAAAAASANLDKNIMYANNDRIAQQYNLQNAGAQPQQFTIEEAQAAAAVAAQSATDPSLTQTAPEATPTAADTAKTQPTSQAAGGGRVLASSKRAAQNRAAQRAFRQRKERYIKSLEQKATEFDLSHSIIQDLRKENMYLRDYVVRLQNEVDSLNTELGRAPMFGTAAQRSAQANQSQSALPVALGQNYPIQIDPQTAAVAAAAANVHTQDAQSGLARLAPAEATHNAISMPTGNEPTLNETKPDEPPPQTKKSNRGRKRKNETQTETQ